MSQSVKAVLFDMDGVIVDSEPLHHKAYHLMFEEVGIEVEPELYASFTGQATLAICQTLVSHFSLSHRPEDLVEIKRQYFKDLFDNDKSFDLLPGVLSLIQDYYNQGLVLVLASSASMANINRIFDRFDLNQYFKAKLSGADLKASKPHPEIFINAAQAAAVPPEYCVVIEDSETGSPPLKLQEFLPLPMTARTLKPKIIKWRIMSFSAFQRFTLKPCKK